MRRPTRTRRLSIAAIISSLAFAVIAGAGVRSVWIWDHWYFKTWKTIGLSEGRVVYRQMWGSELAGITDPRFHESGHTERVDLPTVFKFSASSFDFDPSRPGGLRDSGVWIPLWFPLLLLLIEPVRWLIARPASAPAFPVVTDAPQA